MVDSKQEKCSMLNACSRRIFRQGLLEGVKGSASVEGNLVPCPSAWKYGTDLYRTQHFYPSTHHHFRGETP